ncbi:fibroleukin-like [Saccostrea echinata]|uniref:fibroleukin-like n=1 Tax=Saccostrea echinata TaxID=191078 RepID=UPI002A83B254|nr:fibroleukin-like [Saccostrea echinata]
MYCCFFFKASTCLELRALVPAVSGVYRIYPWRDRQRPVDVYCDMKTQGGGWTAIQRRVYGPVRFNRTWSEYKKGFGSAETEYWLGNDLIHMLTVKNTTSLYVSIMLTNRTTLYERYDQFYITDEADDYRIQLAGNATGSLGDSMRDPLPSWNINGMKFSTADRDNDLWPGGPCGSRWGGWWFNHCGKTFLNSDHQYPPWDPKVSNRSHIRETMMMIK